MVAKKRPRGVDCDIVWHGWEPGAAAACTRARPGEGRAWRSAAATRIICDANCCARRDAMRLCASRLTPYLLLPP